MTLQAGVCQELECPVTEGGTPCLRGHVDPIHCDAFAPYPDEAVADTGGDVEAETTQDMGRGDASELGDNLEGMLTGAEPEALVDEVVLPMTTEDAYYLARPTGPRNAVDLQDRSVPLRAMTTLDPAAAENLMADRPCRLILFVGTIGSGKTTLIATLLEQFLKGPAGGWAFAGSQTLLGFLQRSYYASLASGNSQAQTLRTRMGAIEVPWLHLALKKDGRQESMLLADISGEHFRDVAAGGGLGVAASIVRRADIVVHLLDCSAFKELHNRQVAATRFRATVRRMVEGGMFAPQASHVIVLTKSDTVDGDTLKFVRGGATQVAEKLGFAPVITTAARPDLESGIEQVGIVETLDAMASASPAPGVEEPVELATRLPRVLRRVARSSSPLAGLMFEPGEDVDE